MMNKIALASGARSVNRVKRLWFLLWAFNLGLAAIAALPLAALARADVGSSVWAAQLARALDIAWIAEAVFYWRDVPFTTTGYAVSFAALGALVANTFFAGGAISVLSEPEFPYTPRRFFEGCGRFFWRFVRLFICSLFCYGLALVVNGILSKTAHKLWGEGMVERPLVLFGYFRFIVLAALLMLVNMVFDYAKIRIVRENRRSSFGSMVWAWRFVFRNFARTAALFSSIAGFAILFALAYWALRAILPDSTAGWLFLVAVCQQVFLLARIWVRLMFWSSQTVLYDELNPAYHPAPQPVFSL